MEWLCLVILFFFKNYILKFCYSIILLLIHKSIRAGGSRIKMWKIFRSNTLYSTRSEGRRAALIKILFDTTRNEAEDEMEASESFILVTSRPFDVGSVVTSSLKESWKIRDKNQFVVYNYADIFGIILSKILVTSNVCAKWPLIFFGVYISDTILNILISKLCYIKSSRLDNRLKIVLTLKTRKMFNKNTFWTRGNRQTRQNVAATVWRILQQCCATRQGVVGCPRQQDQWRKGCVGDPVPVPLACRSWNATRASGTLYTLKAF